jgi:ribosome-associated protein
VGGECGNRFSESGLARGAPAVSVRIMSKNQSAPDAPEEIKIRAEPIDLSQLLKFAGLFDSGGAAKHAINGGAVKVDGVVEKASRKKISAGAKVECAGRTLVVKLYR